MNTAEHLCSAVSSALFSVPFIEGFDPAFGGCLPLLASVERMALRADIDAQFFFHRACQECIPTSTGHFDLFVFRMDFFPHYRLHLTFDGRFRFVMRRLL